jgi:hypothetical protein
LKIENLNLPTASRSAMPAQKSVSPSRTSVASTTAVAAAQPSAMRPIAGEERRRSQRVLLRVRAQVHVALEGKATTFEVLTLNVNPHGALVVVDKFLASGTRLVLENRTTRERVACRVARPPRESPEGFQIPLEFDSPAPQFWRITFPPADWRPED